MSEPMYFTGDDEAWDKAETCYACNEVECTCEEFDTLEEKEGIK